MKFCLKQIGKMLGLIKVNLLIFFFLEITDCTLVLPNCECGVSNSAFKNRIIGGVDTAPHEYPWQAAIFDENDEIFCGGSVISNLHILTAGHCVYYTNPYTLHALLGMHDRILRNGIRYDFVDVFLNPHFKPLEYHDTSDMAIVQVDRPITFSYRVVPICLPQSETNLYDNLKATVAGWGRMWSNGENSRFLQETKVVVQPWEKCRSTKIGQLVDPNTMICAYAKNADACQGDSGGPLFYESGFNRFEQFGVISFGIGCGTENSPGIYTKVTSFLPWIRKIISSAAICRDRDMI